MHLRCKCRIPFRRKLIKMKPGLLLALMFLPGFTGCKHQPQDVPAPVCQPVSFARDVKPIIQQSCATYGCHVAGSPDGDFNQFMDLKEKVTNGSFKNSVIDWKAPRMPETHQLPEAQLRVLQCWLNDNAPEN